MLLSAIAEIGTPSSLLMILHILAITSSPVSAKVLMESKPCPARLALAGLLHPSRVNIAAIAAAIFLAMRLHGVASSYDRSLDLVVTGFNPIQEFWQQFSPFLFSNSLLCSNTWIFSGDTILPTGTRSRALSPSTIALAPALVLASYGA